MKKTTYADTAFQILTEHSVGPMNYCKITEIAISDYGLKSNRKKKGICDTMFNSMARDRRFINLGKGNFHFAEKVIDNNRVNSATREFLEQHGGKADVNEVVKKCFEKLGIADVEGNIKFRGTITEIISADDNFTINELGEFSLCNSIVTKGIELYDMNSLTEDGCFVDVNTVEEMHENLKKNMNIILQGPPGTGKTWLAKKLAYLCAGHRNDERIKLVQFHPGYSYENFIIGLLPNEKNGLTWEKGPFLKFVKDAKNDENSKFFIIIEEINRANLTAVFGEMMTLLESNKRYESESIELVNGEREFIPRNLYIIGTMNLVDTITAKPIENAMRRRFAFFDMRPIFDEKWKNFVNGKFGIDSKILAEIGGRLELLNKVISKEPSLGEQFQIGHSFVIPQELESIEQTKKFYSNDKNSEKWFYNVVNTNIGPLLRDYPLHSQKTATKWIENLKKEFVK